MSVNDTASYQHRKYFHNRLHLQINVWHLSLFRLFGWYSGWKINLNCNKATITASPSAVACDGDPVNLTANQGVAYIWSTGANTQSISVVAAGNYVVTVTDENECSRPSAPVGVNINPLPPTPTISVNEGLLQATPSSGYTFKWYFNGRHQRRQFEFLLDSEWGLYGWNYWSAGL